MSDIFVSDQTFADLGLRDSVLKGIEHAGFTSPTYIQAALIGPMLAGRDIIGQAKTGTGKTAAFALPLLQMAQPEGIAQALVLAPTRELANQLTFEINQLGQRTSIRAVSIVGGESYRKQLQDLKHRGGQIAVGTPGRVMDLYQRGQLPFNNVRHVVLDEIDRMLDIGFRDDIRKLLNRINTDHQTVFVSATISDEIERLARQFMKHDVEKITVASKSLTVSQVTQKHVPVRPWDKRRMLHHLLTHEQAALTVVFCRTKKKVSDLTRFLNDHDIEAFEIHGDLRQAKRNRIIKRLREGKLEVLVASDLASRGLDVEGITHIINYDLPEDPEVYVHRIGRTARAGRDGTAWSFVEPDQGQMLTEIEKLTGVEIPKLEYGDFEPCEKPANWKDDKPQRFTPSFEPPKPRSRFGGDAAVADDVRYDPSQFPGGIVPKNPPRRTLGSRLPTRRGKR